MREYFNNIWQARYFWIHLAMADLRSRWRRSFFGILWSIMQPLGLTMLLVFVFSKLFNRNIITCVPYIFSGIITWDFINLSVTGGALSFVQSSAYIRQCKHPLAIYSLRLVIQGLLILCLTSSTLLVWSVIIFPQNVGITWLAILSFFPLLGLIFWPMATLLAYITVRFHDLPHAIGLIMQALWFVSPVYFEANMFRQGGLGVLLDYNPIYHILQIIRAPLLEGQWPTAANYGFALATAFIIGLLAILVGRKVESRVIFYL